MSPLSAQLLGPPRFLFRGALLEPGTRKARALLAYLCATGRPVPRTQLAELLWGPGALRNLRQELYVLRQLPGAEEWLAVDRQFAGAACESDLAALLRAGGDRDPQGMRRGPFCEGLDDVGAPAWEDWLETTRLQADEALRRATLASVHVRLASGDDDGARALVAGLMAEGAPDGPVREAAIAVGLLRAPAPDRPRGGEALPEQPDARRLLRLAVLHPLPLDPQLAGRVLQLDPIALADAFQLLTDGGWLADGAALEPVRERTSQALAPQTRQALHRALADALEEAGSPAHLLAHHREGAGQLELAGGLWLDAARSRGDLQSLEGAVRCACGDDAKAEALREGARALRSQGQVEAATAWTARLRTHATHTQRPAHLRTAAVEEALLAAWTGELEGAERALVRAAELGGSPELTLAKGSVAWLSGKAEAARAMLTDGLASPDPDHRLWALNALGAVAATTGDLAEANRLHRAALDLARRAGRRSVVVRLLNSLGANAQRAGDLEGAASSFAEAASLAEHLGDGAARGALLYNLASIQIARGRPGAARQPSRRLLDLAVHHPRLRALGYRVRSELERAVGRPEEAAGWSARAADAFEAVGDEANALASRFNLALGRHLTDPDPATLTDLVAAHGALGELGRPDLADAAGAELALCLPAADARQLARSLTPSSTAAAARLRADLLTGRPPAPDDLAWIDRATQASAAHLAALGAHLQPERADALRERARQLVSDGAPGLLASQHEAWQTRVEGWLADPTRW